MKRLFGALALAFLVCSGVPAAPAGAQETAVTLQLVSQTPVVMQYHRGALDLKLLAINGGATTLRNLTVRVSFGPHVVTSVDFEQVLTGELRSVIASDQKTLHFDIGAGHPHRIDMHVNVERLERIDQTDSQVYPARIELLSETTVLASLTTPMIYLVDKPPEQPLLVSTWVQLSAPIAFSPDDTLTDATFPSAIAKSGALRAPLDAVEKTTRGRHPHGVLDLVLDPMLITQARDLEDGYRLSDGTTVAQPDQTTDQAGKFIQRLAAATGHPDTVETVAQPYGDPILPAMLNSGLGGELAAARDEARAVVNDLHDEPVEPTAPSVVRPRDGLLSDAVLDSLAGEIVLGNADTVDRTPYQDVFGSAPAPTVPTATGATMVLPDPTIQALFERTDLFTDPVRGAQIILGELGVIWKQAPSPGKPIRRGVAIAPPPTLPPDVWSSLLEGISDAQFLRPVTVSRLVAKADPSNPNGSDEAPAPLATQDDSRFDSDYADRIAALHGAVDALRSMLPDEDVTARDLRRQLFVATAPAYQFDPSAGAPWLDSVQAATDRVFEAAEPAGSEQFTFSSTAGEIPIRFGDPGPTPLAISVELRSSSFTFPDGNRKDITLNGPNTIVQFPVVTQGSGQNEILVLVHAPDGRVINTTRIEVRSTAVNRIALLVTAGAAAGLVALYARRWVRRRKTAAS